MASNTIDESLEKIQIKIGGIQCSFCAQTIKQALLRINGVKEVRVSLAHEETLVRYDTNLINPGNIKETLRDLGFKIRDPNKVRSFEEEEQELQKERNRLFITILLTVISLTLMVFMWLGFKLQWMPWLIFIIAIITMFIPGWYIKRMAWASIRRGILNQHVLLEFAAFGGLLGGIYGFFAQPWPTGDFFAVSVFVTTYHILSGYVSLFVRTRSSQAIKKLMELQPSTARVIKDNGKEEETPIELIDKGDKVRIRTGEKIPVDGIVIKGISSVDQSLVTGESIPIIKSQGDDVIGGSLNQQGTIIVEVSKIGEESFLQQISRYIQEARVFKPGIIILIDYVLKYFVRIVLSAAVIAFIFWTIGAWLLEGIANFKQAILATLAVLIMGYPCALGMATPLAMIRGGGIAAQRGILMRSGEAFQAFKDVNKIVLDKTGTLTIGKPKIVDILLAEDYDEKEFLSLVASIEVGSTHPIGKAIVEYALFKNVILQEVNNFQEMPGQGVKGNIYGNVILAGNLRMIKSEGIIIDTFINQRIDLENQGLTLIDVVEDKKMIGLIAIGDVLKKDAKETVKLLENAGIEPIIITGDNWYVAKAIAKDLRIKKFLAEVLPQEKAIKIRTLQSQGNKVAMVGDGINDAPALMQADIGIAIGAGTDIAIESADIILVNERLKGILDAYSIGKSSYIKTVQNIILAFLFNAIGVVTGIFGLIHPIWAMVAMALSVTTVLLNSFANKIFTKLKS
jgi:heavy metal translocating P-type ATPase